MPTVQEVAAALGEDAQVCGGSVVVYREGKHVLVAQTTDLGFEVTKEGKEILDGTAVTEDGTTVILAKPKKTKVPVAEPVAEPVSEYVNDPLAGL